MLKSSEDCRTWLFTYLFFQFFAAFLSSLNFSSEIIESHSICKASRLRNVSLLNSCFTFTDFIKSQFQKCLSTKRKGRMAIGVKLFSWIQASQKFWFFPKWISLKNSMPLAKDFSIELEGKWDLRADPAAPPHPKRKSIFHFSFAFYFFFLDLFLPQG